MVFMTLAVAAIMVASFRIRNYSDWPHWPLAGVAASIGFILIATDNGIIGVVILAVAGVGALAYQIWNRPVPPPPVVVPRDTRWDQIELFIKEPDPYKTILEYRREHRLEQLHIGMGDGGWLDTPKQSNCLILGPPRSGKTTALLVPQIITATGPVVAVTTKFDTLYVPTAQTRARVGQLWHYNPSGEGSTLPGCKELRWSPLTGAEDWKTALRTGDALANSVTTADKQTGGDIFFRTGSAQAIAVTVYGAAIAGKGIGFVIRVMSGNESATRELQDIVGESGNEHAINFLSNFMQADSRTRANIRNSAFQCFNAYSFDESVASTVNVNFDPKEFAESNDTIYITGSPAEQEAIGPLIVNLLAQIRRARYELWMTDEASDGHGRMPMFWALDELTSLAKIQRFPRLVSQSADTGLLISAVCQSLSQTEAVWGAEGKEIMDFFNSVVVFPGIRNRVTLEQIAALGGKQFITRITNSWTEGESTSETVGNSKQGWSSSESYSQSSSTTQSETDHYVDRFTPGDIHKAGGDGRMIYLRGHIILGLQAMSYYGSAPFQHCLINNAVIANVSFHDERKAISPPRVSTVGLSDEWAMKYLEAKEQFQIKRGDEAA